jgi:hypothetical protein
LLSYNYFKIKFLKIQKSQKTFFLKAKKFKLGMISMMKKIILKTRKIENFMKEKFFEIEERRRL